MPNINGQKPVLNLSLRCKDCGARFPHGAWAEHLTRCPAEDRSAEILESLARRMTKPVQVVTSRQRD